MKCFECGGELKESRETVLDHRLGLGNLTLRNVPVRRCVKCNARELVFPQIASLHRLIARGLVQKKTRFMGEEIRYLRKYLGWSSVDLARRLGVAPETVSRWENGHEPIGISSDRVLRLVIQTTEPIDSYDVASALDAISAEEPRAEPLNVEVNEEGYVLV